MMIQLLSSFHHQGTRQHADVQFLAVSHSGVRLVKRQQIGQLESLHVLQSFG